MKVSKLLCSVLVGLASYLFFLTPAFADIQSDGCAGNSLKVEQLDARAPSSDLNVESGEGGFSIEMSSDKGPYDSFKGNSFRFQDGIFKSEDESPSLFSIPQWPDGATSWGIDVSYAQGRIDWAKVKAAGCDFAIIRCGFGSGGNDDQFINNVRGCQQNKIPFGIYLYSYAWDAVSAKREAEWTLSRLKAAGLSASSLSLPVYFDLENEVGNPNHPDYRKPAGVDENNNYRVIKGGPSAFAEIAKAYCDSIQKAGFEAGIYANLNWWNNYLTSPIFNSWDRWVAQYNSTCDYRGQYDMWQYTSKGSIDGISGYVDANWWYGATFNPGMGSTPDKSLISYEAHVQNIGWQSPVFDGAVAGTTGRNLSMEALRLRLSDSSLQGSIQIRAHISQIGWQDWTSGVGGTTGRSLPIEAIQIRLIGKVSDEYDVWYRIHSADYGWLGWTKNGMSAGSQGYAKAAQAIQIKLVKKGGPAPGDTNGPFKAKLLNVQAHVQNLGWQTPVSEGSIAGTTGQSLRLEALKVSLGPGTGEGSLDLRAHISNIGWQDWRRGIAGTTGRSLAIEALQLRLNGAAANSYDVWYRVHSAEFGWFGWAKNGDKAGSEGFGRSAEGIQISLLPKGSPAPGSTIRPFVKR